MKPCLIALCLLLATAIGRAGGPEEIHQFGSRIQVQPDGGLQVTETIQVQATGEQIRHGIYRDFPLIYQSPGGLRAKNGFALEKVLCDGHQEEYHLSDRENGIRIYIGSAAANVPPGLHTYELTYATDRQLSFLTDHDELYWNVTGNGWVFPIDHVNASVILPSGATITKLTAYTGPQGARGQDFSAENLGDHATFATTRKLMAKEGLTVVVEWPKGVVTAPTNRQLNVLKDNLGLTLSAIFGFLALVYYGIAWRYVQRDAQRRVIMPRTTPPADLSPADVRYVWRKKFDKKAFTATVLNLAVKGAIKIRESREGIFRNKRYTLEPQAQFSEALPPTEALVRRKLFGSDEPLTLEQENRDTLRDAMEKLSDRMDGQFQDRYFMPNSGLSAVGILICILSVLALIWDSSQPNRMAVATGISFTVPLILITLGRQMPGVVRIGLMVIAIFGVFAAVVELESFPAQILFLPASLGGLAGLFHWLLRTYTPEGQQIRDEIAGFQLYLSVANASLFDLVQQGAALHFEKFLPYALALDVEDQWSRNFASALASALTQHDSSEYSSEYEPNWYHGDTWNHANSDRFASALSDSLTDAISSASKSPNSDSGGSDSGSSSGSSGDGGGGGGGGGW